MKRSFCDRELDQIAFPMGGLGAGMICMQGTGALGNVSIQNEPNVHFEPNLFAALHICGDTPNGRVLEAPVPGFKVFSRPALSLAGAGNGLQGKTTVCRVFPGKRSSAPPFRSPPFPFRMKLSRSAFLSPVGAPLSPAMTALRGFRLPHWNIGLKITPHRRSKQSFLSTRSTSSAQTTAPLSRKGKTGSFSGSRRFPMLPGKAALSTLSVRTPPQWTLPGSAADFTTH